MKGYREVLYGFWSSTRHHQSFHICHTEISHLQITESGKGQDNLGVLVICVLRKQEASVNS